MRRIRKRKTRSTGQRNREIFDPNNDLLGNLIRQARTGAYLTQKHMSEQTGIHKTKISGYENGRYTPSMTNFKKIKRYLMRYDAVTLKELAILEDAYDIMVEAKHAANYKNMQ